MALRTLIRFSLRHPRAMIASWGVALLVAAPGAFLLGRLAQGGSEAIPGSESRAVMERVNARFGRGASHAVPVVVSSDSLPAQDPRFAAAIQALATRLDADARVTGVTHTWNSGLTELLGRDGRSALLLVQPDVDNLGDAETATADIRALLADVVPGGFQARVTGMAAMFHDLNRQSARDLLKAELVGIPLTLLVLFLVFRTAAAGGAALGVAVTALVLSSAFLYAANGILPATVLAQNVVTMIGLGAGTDYALFVLMHHRDERARGADGTVAIERALEHAGPAVAASGLAVAGGFASLFLVNARFVHSLALGGVVVVLVALAATFTLLPALMHLAGHRLTRATHAAAANAAPSVWARWAEGIMRRPKRALAAGLAISALCAWPALEARNWTFGARDLPASAESRLGFEALVANFDAGWSAPTVLLAETSPAAGLGDPAVQSTIGETLQRLRADSARARVIGPRPAEDGRTAMVLVVPRASPESDEAQALVRSLRERARADSAGGVRWSVGGGTAILADFDTEMRDSLRRVMVAVILVTFVLLLVFLRSVTVPLKAIAANLLSVFAAYGFLVVVFQYGFGASLIGITPPGGLNSFVVLMLFTILFGLSMDYEIFLLTQIRHEYLRTRDTVSSVSAGLAGTASVITGAAAVMVCLFGSFGFFGLTASREFGLGLAFAVAFDATVVRLLLVPTTMRLLGKWNWWPGVR